ncbi:lipoprotein [Bordetella pertussis]|nr:lipoprotein [Bordetella pertussis]
MEQPPDLRNAYARAYEHSVTADARRVAGFVARHRDQVDTDGPLTQVRDPSVRSELNVLLQALNGRSDQVSQAQALLNGLAGPAPQAP